jgi:hypothetical protein
MGEPPALNGKHILLLEDDADARDSMACAPASTIRC